MSDMNTACIAEGDMMSSFQSSQLASSKMIFHKSSSLCPILRLLCGCQRSMDGELTELGLLIGSPVEFPTNVCVYPRLIFFDISVVLEYFRPK